MTATAANRAASENPNRSIRIYERLLILYPKSFRQEYGADMVQTFGDLLMASGEPGRVWHRIFGDVATSATRQRLIQLGGAGGGGRPWAVLLAVLVVAAAFFLNLGSGAYLIVLPALAVVFVLPALGFGLLWHAGHVWRTTGTRTVGRALVGLACFGPVVWAVTMSADDWGYWVGVGIVLLLIVGLGGGALWGLIVLVSSRPSPTSIPAGRRWGAIGLIVAAIAVLGGMAGMGFNSYLNSRPPPGDHSVANASVESRALWDAAFEGDLAVVVALVESCADPFVHFDDGGRARTNAEEWTGAWGGEPVPEPRLSVYEEIIDRLKVAEETWSERCNS